MADLLGQLEPARGGQLHVLDVGGGTGLLRRFLPRARVTLVDVVPGGAEGDLALGDGSRLPLRDAAVDAVCAFDTLEHVPPPRRDDFVRECARVARSWVVLAGPYADPAVAAAEQELDGFLKETLSLEHAFLREHLDYGLPERAHSEELLRAAGARVVAVGHGNLELWQTLMRLEIALDEPPLLAFGASLYELYARFLYPRDHRPPVYRQALVGALGESPLPDVDAVLEPAGAPSDAERSVVRTLEEALGLFAEDADRKAWLAERSEFQRAVETLEVDLEGHRAVLADREEQLAEHKRVMRELEDRVWELYWRTPEGRLKKLKRALTGKRPAER